MAVFNERQITSEDTYGIPWHVCEEASTKFRDEAVKLSKTISEVFGKYAGMGADGLLTSGLLGRMKPDQIKEKPPQKHYIFNMSKFPKLVPAHGLSNIPVEWKKLAISACTKAGFKKGNEFVSKRDDDSKVLQAFYYKKLNKDEVACAMIQVPAMFAVAANLQIHLWHVKFDDHFKKNLMESAGYPEFEDALQRQKDAATAPGDDNVETRDLESVFGSRDEKLGFAHSITLASDWESDTFFPKAREKMSEMMDLTDRETRQSILSMNEAETSNVLHSLANRLYDNIVKRVDDIDYGDIPGTKGDITKLPNYEQVIECNDLIRQILVEYHQDTKPVDTIVTAIGNIQERKDLFEKAYRYRSELPTLMYENLVLAVIGATSYLIATSIEYIKTPNSDAFDITFNKMMHVKTRDYMLYGSLEKFNKMVDKGDFDRAMEYIIQNRIKKVTEAAATGILGIGAVVTGVMLVLSIIPILRELVFFFFYMRTKISDFFDIQADLLQMNAYRLVQGEESVKTDAEKEDVIKKQLTIVGVFRKLSNFFAIKSKEAEVKATRDIVVDDKKQKISDLTDSLPDGATSALF
ncbi:hypothetical protein [uncultured Duncaniella sp.]|uniref:hypothetical protein n=1 Tax=uncultured Duncaniella sp. TaxID=2768039 RepID=UPI00262A0A50|nr:hypothetical protein [uncultured Duncaniella sp.]